MAQSKDEANHSDRRNALDYAVPRSRSGLSRSSRLILWCALLVVATFFASVAVTPFLRRTPGPDYRGWCRSNMRQIGEGIAMYANEHNGRFPDDLATLFANGDLETRVFVCPLSSDTPAPAAPTTQATAAGILQPGQ
jgi:hypothetical protein